jgi:hypothetical protein
MCCALLRRERGATTVRYSFRAAALGLATLAIDGMTQLGLLRAAAAKLRTRLAQHDPPDHVDLATGEHVPHSGRPHRAWIPTRRRLEGALLRQGPSSGT